MTTTFHSTTAILRSFSEIEAKAFYIDYLDFEIVFEHRFEPDTPLYMGLRNGMCSLHLSEHHGDASPGAHIRIAVDDVRALCAALQAKSYANANPDVEEMPWGGEEMTVIDPFSNRLTFFNREDQS